jgi:hypothetical protein
MKAVVAVWASKDIGMWCVLLLNAELDTTSARVTLSQACFLWDLGALPGLDVDIQTRLGSWTRQVRIEDANTLSLAMFHAVLKSNTALGGKTQDLGLLGNAIVWDGTGLLLLQGVIHKRIVIDSVLLTICKELILRPKLTSLKEQQVWFF